MKRALLPQWKCNPSKVRSVALPSYYFLTPIRAKCKESGKTCRYCSMSVVQSTLGFQIGRSGSSCIVGDLWLLGLTFTNKETMPLMITAGYLQQILKTAIWTGADNEGTLKFNSDDFIRSRYIQHDKSGFFSIWETSHQVEKKRQKLRSIFHKNQDLEYPKPKPKD